MRLYGTPGYLARHPPIRSRADLADHTFIGYVDELLFSERLRYLEDLLPASKVILRSTSVVAQYHAALQGQSLAILPCFIAAQDPRLTPVLEQEVEITRSFWMYCHEDLRKLKRVNVLWEFIRKSALRNAGLLAGTQTPCATCPKAGSRQGLRKPRGCCAAPSLAAGASAGRMSAAPPGRESPRRPRRS